MARPKSDDKRTAILAAATRLIAERGLDAVPTAAISKAANVAEGTLFTYFKTKDDLVNQLYRQIKLELAESVMAAYPRNKMDVRARLQHIWNGYVNWSAENPEQRKVLNQLKVSDRISEESKAVGYAPFAEVQSMTVDAIDQKLLQDVPVEFIAATMGALAETTLDFMQANAAESNQSERYRSLGFALFWKSIAADGSEC